METISTVLSEGRVVVPALNEANSLYQDGYGSFLEGQLLTLKPFEVLYLVERTRVTVIDEGSRQKMTFQELLAKFSSDDPQFWVRFMVYRDLRIRGFVVRLGPGLGVDFFVYERGSYGKKPPAYMVYSIWEGTSDSIEHLCRVLDDAISESRVLRIVVVDRRGEVVYYTLSKMDFTEAEEQGLRPCISPIID